MEEQGGETRESKYRRLHYDGGSKMQESPEGFGFMNQMIETDSSEKLEISLAERKDPCGPKSRCREVLTPLVYSDEAHKQLLLAAIQREAALEADLKLTREKSFEEFARHCAAKSSGTKADQNLGESSSTIV